MENLDDIKQKLVRYKCHKEVKAVPMSNVEYAKLRGYGEEPYPNMEGYFVMYEPDDYMSWSPKDVFESGYRKSENFIDRIKIELDELSERIEKLDKFVYDKRIKGEHIEHEYLLVTQLNIMRAYHNILEIRYVMLTQPLEG